MAGIYGLSGSGMDVDAMVKSLMTARRAQDAGLTQKKTILEWQKAAKNKVYDSINNFRNTIFNYKLQATLNPNKVSSSNTGVATATARADAANVNHSLAVSQLADGVKMTSTASLSAAGTTVDRTTIASQFYSGTAVGSIPNMSITIANGSENSTIAVSPTGTINDFVSQINSAGINVTANYDSTLDRFFLTTNNSGATADISFAGSNTAGMSFLADKLKLPVAVIATGANVSSSSSVQGTVQIDPSKTLATQFKNLTDSTLQLANSVTGTTQTITIKTTDTLQDVMDSINSGSNATASFDASTGKFSITPTKSGTLSIGTSDTSAKGLFSQLHLPTTFNAGKVTTSTSSVTIPLDKDAALNTQFTEFPTISPATDPASFTLKIANGTAAQTSVTINPKTDTLETMLTKIGAVADVDASYDPDTGKVTLKSADGKNLNFAGSDATGSSFLANTLKIHQAGKDATFTLDGAALTQASNAFTIAGVSYNLTGVSAVTSSTDSTLQAMSIGVTSDVDKAVTSIKSLVDAYNVILTEVNGKRDETRYKDFLPLTDDQKSSMKEADITAWNLKAQSGMLHNDSTLNSLVNSMRNAFSNPISGLTGTYKNASSIGITTGAYTEKGKLYLDETKLRTALTADPTILNKMFASAGTNTAGTTTIDPNTQGIAGRLYDALKTTMDLMATQAGTTATTATDTKSDIAKRMKEYTTRITAANDRADDIEAAYYTRFNAMETALSKLSTQSTWLSQQLSS